MSAGDVTVPCGACDGTGRIVHRRMTEAYLRLGSSWRTTSDLAAALGISQTNACNVLAALRKRGLIERRGVGRARAGQYEWRRSR